MILYFFYFFSHSWLTGDDCSLNLFQINDFRCRLISLRCGWSGACCCRALLLVRITFGLRRALFVLVRYSHVFTQTVLVLEGFLAVIAFSRWLGCVLCADMSPEIHRGDNKLAVLTLRPLAVRLFPRLLVSF